ncbi:hypothetical protein COEREDRAFT_82760 [Coemansia reversa NRRL 1564]|uniref:Uncharacterized protein n=1 Tax=Coemansia reversa (strain ATCC 12441 / NRRL 1564) TaxID=763665 RepID=A0A2G5B669_COERN|nr:hypothetical protein COEREDRAFT_82760 [Coemansia reversa NRRL 1564]|eukprot:PIA14498.1 hypothetical protein COEREDRAFT_82760 [Coemansia reversa NRRL 1564]
MFVENTIASEIIKCRAADVGKKRSGKIGAFNQTHKKKAEWSVLPAFPSRNPSWVLYKGHTKLVDANPGPSA